MVALFVLVGCALALAALVVYEFRCDARSWSPSDEESYRVLCAKARRGEWTP